MSELELLDEGSAADLVTYVGRAKRHDEGGAARLQALPTGDGGVLAVWTCVLPGRGLVHDGLVLGLRTLLLAEEPAPLDVLVPLAALTDRFARSSGTTLSVPPTTVAAGWAGVSPPRSGWEPVGEVRAGRLADVSAAGVVEVATGTPDGAGAAAVADLRARVWGRPVDAAGVGREVAAGAAFGMSVLGFLGPEPGAQGVAVHRVGPWRRLSSPLGYVLSR